MHIKKYVKGQQWLNWQSWFQKNSRKSSSDSQGNGRHDILMRADFFKQNETYGKIQISLMIYWKILKTCMKKDSMSQKQSDFEITWQSKNLGLGDKHKFKNAILFLFQELHTWMGYLRSWALFLTPTGANFPRRYSKLPNLSFNNLLVE